MSRNLSDSKQERDLLNRIARLEQQVRERGTVQTQGYDTIPKNAYNLGQFSTTLAANALYTHTFAYRYNFIGLSSFQSQELSPVLALTVDTNNPAFYLWPLGSSLTSGQKAVQVSVTRDWMFGLTPQDPRNTAVYHVQLRNLDSISHTYYGDFEVIGNVNLDPFVPMDLF